MLFDPPTKSTRRGPSSGTIILRDCDYDHIAALGQRLLGACACAVSLDQAHTWLAVREDTTREAAQSGLDWTHAHDITADLDAGDRVGRIHLAHDASEPSVAAVPICLADGQSVGSLQAIDFAPHAFDENDLGWLSRLSACVAREVELRLTCAIDPLTGVWARPAFMEALDHGIEHDAVALAIMDLDGFKAINDTFGHMMGDTVLAGTGQLMRRHLSDLPVDMGRLGGEEFGLLFADMSFGEVFGALHAMRQALSCEAFEGLAGIQVTASIGVTQIPRGAQRSDLLYRADEALYHAKFMGKNRVEDAAELDLRRPHMPVARKFRDTPARRVRAV